MSLAVSVVIPTYNRADLICRPVDSVLAVLQPGDELIIIDDGSTDETAEVLARYGDRIRYAWQPNSRAGAARNHGVRLARNPLIAFLDSDDEWTADKLIIQRALMEQRPDILFSFTDFFFRYDSGREVHHFLQRWHQDPRPWSEIFGPGIPYSTIAALPAGRPDFAVYVGNLYPLEVRANYVAASTLVVRREEAGEALYWGEGLPFHEDTECYGRLGRAGLAAYLECETCWHWGHDGPRMTQLNEYIQATARLTVLERVWGADPAFLAQYGDRYQAAVAQQHRKRAWWLLKEGRTGEARQELRLAGSAPWQHSVMAALPSWMIPVWLVRQLRTVRRALRMRGYYLLKRTGQTE